MLGGLPFRERAALNWYRDQHQIDPPTAARIFCDLETRSIMVIARGCSIATSSQPTCSLTTLAARG